MSKDSISIEETEKEIVEALRISNQITSYESIDHEDGTKISLTYDFATGGVQVKSPNTSSLVENDEHVNEMANLIISFITVIEGLANKRVHALAGLKEISGILDMISTSIACPTPRDMLVDELMKMALATGVFAEEQQS